MSELLYLSPSFERVWGRTLEEAYANPFLFVESILPEDRHLLFADMAMSRAGAGDPNRHLDYRVQRPDESIRWIRNRIFQIPDRDGNPYRVAGVCSDITEQKQMEEELRRANRIEAIGHLAAGIAHEINTPIQYIGDNVRFWTRATGTSRRPWMSTSRCGRTPPPGPCTRTDSRRSPK
jgi:PAS domain S-box-containing protein